MIVHAAKPEFMQVRNSKWTEYIDYGDWKTYGDGRLDNSDLKNNLLYICQGMADIWLADGFGHETHLTALGAGELLGELNLFCPVDCNIEIEAKELVVEQFSRETVIKLMEADRELLVELIQSLAIKLGYITASIEEISLKSIRKRLARILVLNRINPDTGTGSVRKPLSQGELACRLGTHRVVISRYLSAVSAVEKCFWQSAGIPGSGQGKTITGDREG